MKQNNRHSTKVASVQVGIDTQCLSYLIDAISGVAAPTDAFAPQKLALVRLFLYRSGTLWVTPRVAEECGRIRSVARAELHVSYMQVLFGELPIHDSFAIAERARELSHYHSGANDCTIVAEAEAVGHAVLLSFDSRLVRRLRDQTVVQLMEPAEYWDKLAVPKGATPDKMPHATSPLSLESWWRW